MEGDYITNRSYFKGFFLFFAFHFLSFSSFGQECTVYTDNSGYTIPDFTVSYFDAASVTVSDSFSILDLDVTIDIDHTFNEDLEIRLVHRVGGVDIKSIDLSIDKGGSGDGFDNVTFDEGSVNSLPNGGNSVLGGTYNPDGNLDDFVGDNSVGDWVLQIRDDASSDVGNLNSFSINICKIHTVSCDNVYASTSSSTLGNRNSLYTLTGSTMKAVYTAPQIIGGLAISGDGNAYYDDASAPFPLYSSDGSTQVSEGAELPNQLVGQGANNSGDVYYIDTSYNLRVIVKGSGATTNLGALNFGADTVGATLQAGDLAFDGSGRLHWYASVGGTGASYLFVIDTNTLSAENLGNVGPDGATGVAFNSVGDMITSTDNGNGTSDIYSIDFSSPTLAGTLIGTASPSVYDMGSCSLPTYNPILSAVKSVKNITKSANPANIAFSGDVLEYTIVVTNTGNLSASSTTFLDAIPVSTTYIPNSTQLNGASVADVGGDMPYVTATEIHSDAQPEGVVAIGSPVTITFRVTVVNGTLPSSITNTGTIEYPIVSGGATTNQSVDSNTVSTPTGDICTLGINDSDGDGIDDICDLDDDNDGILDSDEGSCATNDFTIFGGNGGSTTSFSQLAVSSTIFNFYYVDNSVSVSVNGGGINANNVLQLESTPVPGEVFLEFTDGSAIGQPWLANNNGLPRLQVKIDFSGNVTIYGSRSTNSSSLDLMRTRDSSAFNTVTFVGGSNSFDVVNPDGVGNDAIGGVATVYSSCTDTDSDNIPNHLDTDSDNDGCPDALEADGGVLSTQLSTLVGGSVGAGSSLLNLGTVSNNNGIPLPFGTAGGIETAGQNSTVAMLDASNHVACTTDLSLTKTVDNSLPKFGEDITYTFTLRNDGVLDATGIVVTDLMPAGLTFKSKTSTDYNEGDNKWSVATLLPGGEVSVSVTVEVATSGKIINKAQITENNTVGLKEDIDSTPNNDK